MQLVTIEELRAHCNVAGNYDDDLLTTYAEAGANYAQDFLNRRVFPDALSMASAIEDDTAGYCPMVVVPSIRAAVLLYAGHLYRNREAVTSETANELPYGVTQLLWPHRVGLGI